MKKVLLGILTLIPVIVLLVVAMVSNIVALQAHISVEDVVLRLKSTGEDAYDISLSFDSIRQKTFSITDYIDVVVYPQRANNYTLEYELSGDILYTDVEYEDNRNEERHWLISLKKKFRRAFSRMKSTAKRFILSEANFWIRRKS